MCDLQCMTNRCNISRHLHKGMDGMAHWYTEVGTNVRSGLIVTALKCCPPKMLTNVV